MKKLGIFVFMAATILSLASCGKKVVVIDNTVVESQGDVDGGGFSVSLAEIIELPEGAKEAYESAIADYTDAELETIGYLGSQVVSGTNYKYLVREAASEEDAIGKVSVVVVYQDLEGKAEVTEMTQVKFSDYFREEKKFAPETLMGGWNVDNAYGSGLSSVCQEAYDKATADFKEYELEPICLMDFEMTHDMVYFILCKASKDQASGLCVLTVKEDFTGNSKLSCVNAFE